MAPPVQLSQRRTHISGKHLTGLRWKFLREDNEERNVRCGITFAAAALLLVFIADLRYPCRPRAARVSLTHLVMVCRSINLCVQELAQVEWR